VVAACREFWAINTVPRLSKSVKPSVVKSDFCTAPPEAIRYGTAKTNPTTFGSLGDWDWTADLKKVSAPALIIHGEEDAIPMAMVAEWASALPNARLVKVGERRALPLCRAAGRGVPGDREVPRAVARRRRASLRDLIEKPHERQRRLVHARDLRIAAVDQEELVRRMRPGAVARAETARR
jgi:hypothetical protein